MKKLLLAVLLVSLASCGVKSDLVRPNGQATSKTERDPSSGHKGDCTRGTRSFVDVLECLL